MYPLKLFGGLVLLVVLAWACSNMSVDDSPQQPAVVSDLPREVRVPTPSPTEVWVDKVIGDCNAAMSGREVVKLTEERYAEILRADGCSETRVAELVAELGGHQAAFQAWFDEQATGDAYWDSLTVADLANCTEAARPTICEARLMGLYAETSITIRERLAVPEQLALERHLKQVREIDEVVEVQGGDFQLTMDEILFTCSLAPRWAADVAAAQEYLTSLGRSDLLGLEVELHQKQVYVTSMQEVCAASTGAPLGGGGSQGAQGPLPTLVPTLSPYYDPTISERVLSDPCFRGTGPNHGVNGVTSYRWDVDCQIEQKQWGN